MQHMVPCPRCHGQGLWYATRCATCRGQQLIERDEQLTLTIPRGVEEGMVRRAGSPGICLSSCVSRLTRVLSAAAAISGRR